MLVVGDIFKTGYDTGPYEIKSISKVCTCPCPIDVTNEENPRPRDPHHHFTCISEEGKEVEIGAYDLNGVCKNKNWTKGRNLIKLGRTACSINIKPGDQITLF